MCLALIFLALLFNAMPYLDLCCPVLAYLDCLVLIFIALPHLTISCPVRNRARNSKMRQVALCCLALLLFTLPCLVFFTLPCLVLLYAAFPFPVLCGLAMPCLMLTCLPCLTWNCLTFLNEIKLLVYSKQEIAFCF